MRRIIPLLCLLLAVCAVAWAEDDLAGVWSFSGGGEVMGMGFRLSADGTGEWLDTQDQHTPAKHLQATGRGFTWTVEDGNFIAVERDTGAAHSYPWSRQDGSIHFASGDGGGFYVRLDERAMRAEIKQKQESGTATEFDLLALDYLDDALEQKLAEGLGLRSVNAAVSWDTDKPGITVDAWHVEQDVSVWLQFTPEAVRAYATDQPWAGMQEEDVAQQSFRCTKGAGGSGSYYSMASWMLDNALRDMRSEQRLRRSLDGSDAAGVTDSLERALADHASGAFQRIVAGMGFTLEDVSLEENSLSARLLDTASNRVFDFSLTPYYETVTLVDESREAPLSHQFYVQAGESVYDWLAQARDSLLAWEQQYARPSLPARLEGRILTFPKGKSYDVYRGPGAGYGRSANGKARVSTGGPITVYGLWNDWLLISYDISGDQARFGWIDAAKLPESVLSACPELQFAWDTMEYRLGVLLDDTPLTDDPQRSRMAFAVLPKAASLHCLGIWQDWMLVEGFLEGQLVMGFVPADAVDLEHGYADDARFVIENAVSWPESDIRAAMEAVRRVYGQNAGAHLLEVRYPEEENAPDNRWWRIREAHPDIQFMRLYATVDDISYYDFEISVDGVARDLIVYCERVPGGDWQAGIGGYE